MKKNMLYKFNKKLFLAYGSYDYEWTLEWGKKNGYKVIEVYVIDEAYYILFRTPVYRSIFPKRSIPIYDYTGSNEEECTGRCVRTQRQIEMGI
jgi:hypothetical protein